MLLCMEAGKKYDFTLFSASNIPAHDWTNTPATIIANRFQHRDFVQPNCCAEELVTEAAGATTRDSCLGTVVHPITRPTNFMSIDDGVAIARQATEDEVIQDVTGVDDLSKDDDCG